MGGHIMDIPSDQEDRNPWLEQWLTTFGLDNIIEI